MSHEARLWLLLRRSRQYLSLLTETHVLVAIFFGILEMTCFGIQNPKDFRANSSAKKSNPITKSSKIALRKRLPFGNAKNAI